MRKMIKKILNRIEKDTNGKVGLKMVLIFVPVAYISYLFHEFGHWFIGEILGNRMTYSLNNVSPRSGQYLDSSHSLWIIMGGPMFTILLSLIFLLVIKRYKVLWTYSFVFFQFFCRFFSLVFGGFYKQDEAKISSILGIGNFTVAIVVLALLFFMIWRGSYLLKLNFKSNWYFLTISVFCELIVIATDKLF